MERRHGFLLEAEFTWVLVEGLTLAGDISYTHVSLSDVPQAQCSKITMQGNPPDVLTMGTTSNEQSLRTMFSQNGRISGQMGWPRLSAVTSVAIIWLETWIHPGNVGQIR
jgi:hypothetical protein